MKRRHETIRDSTVRVKLKTLLYPPKILLQHTIQQKQIIPTRKRVRYPAESKLNASIPERCPRAAAEEKDVGVFVRIREASLSGFKETVDDSHLLFSLFLLVRNRTAKCKCSESSKLTYFRHFCDCQRKWAGLLYYSDELIFSWHVICRVFVFCDARLSAGGETRS